MNAAIKAIDYYLPERVLPRRNWPLNFPNGR